MDVRGENRFARMEMASKNGHLRCLHCINRYIIIIIDLFGLEMKHGEL